MFSAGVSQVSTRGIDPNDLLSPTGSGVAGSDLAFVEGVLAGSLHAVFVMMAVAAVLAGVAAALLPPGRFRSPRPATQAAAPQEELVTAP
jgi:hypothetical protein